MALVIIDVGAVMQKVGPTSSHKFPKMSPGRVTLFYIVVVYSNIRLRTGSKTAVYDCLLKFVTCHTRDVPRARAVE